MPHFYRVDHKLFNRNLIEAARRAELGPGFYRDLSKLEYPNRPMPGRPGVDDHILEDWLQRVLKIVRTVDQRFTIDIVDDAYVGYIIDLRDY